MTVVLYIGGLGRSGSTLLERLLGQCDGVCSVGEFYSLWTRRQDDAALCGCGRTLSKCPVWRPVLSEVGADPARTITRQRRLDRTRYLPLLLLPRLWPPFARRLDEYVALLERTYEILAARTGARVIIDSSKRPSNAVLLRHLRGIDLRVVHLVRDSRGVAYSWSKQMSMEPRPGSPWMTRYSPGRITLRWSAYNILFAALRLLGVPVLRVHYEDLIGDPRAILSRVAEFGGVPTGSGLQFVGPGWAQVERVTHTVTGNPVRFANGRIELVRDDAWRTALPRRRQWLVSMLSLPFLARYGYLARGRRAG